MFGLLADMAADSLWLKPQIYFDCDREMVIENCRRIEEYNEVCIRLVSGKLGINVWGSGLETDSYGSGGLVIRGRISQVEFEERGGAERERPAEGLRPDKRRG
ncbi:YabP/YqfC family sporulation protein [uncultured Ruminococcus sp.]|uniref:YabP/YqfC family sporulation protein n=1 Tax=uncultured Ruminococcus sp. TaxID=165186 RepID=UPI0015683A29|nr:YabP/YqfC family sporulation protein [uncultured Ruminococcus sp.]